MKVTITISDDPRGGVSTHVDYEPAVRTYAELEQSRAGKMAAHVLHHLTALGTDVRTVDGTAISAEALARKVRG